MSALDTGLVAAQQHALGTAYNLCLSLRGCLLRGVLC